MNDVNVDSAAEPQSRVPFLDLCALHAPLRRELASALLRVLDSGRYSGGEEVERFEAEFASYCGVAHAVACSSGTAALHLALRALGIGAGDEVVTVAHTFVATAWAVRYCEAVPRFVDVEPTSRTMDVAAAAAAIGPRTKAVLPVHLYGQPADMARLRELTDRHGLFLVEDAAQAHGARIGARRAGSFGDVGCFSFYPGKNLGALGEGGILVTPHEAVARRARALRDHAQSARYRHDELGFNYRMDAMQAAALRLKLSWLETWNESRSRLAEQYCSGLRGVAHVQVPAEVPGTTSAHHLFVVQHPIRDSLARFLRSRDVETGLHYPTPVHRQPAFANTPAAECELPVTETLARTCLSLPLSPTLRPDQVERVIEAVAEFEGR